MNESSTSSRSMDIFYDSPEWRNSLLPISKLPTELLLQVFIEHIVLFSNNKMPGAPAKPTRIISHVCRKWRELALGCPVLWSHISNLYHRRSEWFNEQLARSSNSSLSLNASLFLRRYPYADLAISRFHMLMAQFGRFRSFELTVEDPLSLTDPLWDYLRQPAPFLHTFWLCHWSTNHRISQSHWDVDVLMDHPTSSLGHRYPTAPTLPSPLFGDAAPNLRSLLLLEYTLDLTSPSLRALRELMMFDVQLTDAPSLSTWINALNAMPLLESLTIIDAIGLSVSVSLPPVMLPALRELRLKGHMLECTTLLSHIIFPATCRIIHVICSRGEDNVDHYSLAHVVTNAVNRWESALGDPAWNLELTSWRFKLCAKLDLNDSISNNLFVMDLAWHKRAQFEAFLDTFNPRNVLLAARLRLVDEWR